MREYTLDWYREVEAECLEAEAELAQASIGRKFNDPQLVALIKKVFDLADIKGSIFASLSYDDKTRANGYIVVP